MNFKILKIAWISSHSQPASQPHVLNGSTIAYECQKSLNGPVNDAVTRKRNANGGKV